MIQHMTSFIDHGAYGQSSANNFVRMRILERGFREGAEGPSSTKFVGWNMAR